MYFFLVLIADWAHSWHCEPFNHTSSCAFTSPHVLSSWMSCFFLLDTKHLTHFGSLLNCRVLSRIGVHAYALNILSQAQGVDLWVFLALACVYWNYWNVNEESAQNSDSCLQSSASHLLYVSGIVDQKIGDFFKQDRTNSLTSLYTSSDNNPHLHTPIGMTAPWRVRSETVTMNLPRAQGIEAENIRLGSSRSAHHNLPRNYL